MDNTTIIENNSSVKNDSSIENNSSQTEFSEIRTLRKKGELFAAYNLGRGMLASSQDNNIDLKRDFAWTCLDLAKAALADGNIQECRNRIQDIRKLWLPQNDIVFKQVFWTLRNILKTYCIEEKDHGKRKDFALELYASVADIPLGSPDVSYSAYIHEMHKLLKDFPSEYIEFFSKIGFNFFSNSDYDEYMSEGDNKKKSSRAEIIYTTFGRSLVNVIESDSKKSAEAKNKAMMYLPLLLSIMNDYPDYPSLPETSAMLMNAVGQLDEARTLLVNELKKKKSNMRLWMLLSDTFAATDTSTALSAICAGLATFASEEQKLPLMEKAAKLMARLGYYPEAKCEMDNIERIQTRRWGICRMDKSLEALKDEGWYKDTEAAKDNRRFYGRHLHKIEDILYKDDKISIVITYANSEKKFLNFITEEDKKGFFNYSKLIPQTPLQGEIYDVVFEHYADNEPCRIKWIRKNNNPSDDCRLFRYTEGRVRMDAKNDFGFVENVYIPADLVAKYHIIHGDHVRIKSIRTFDNIKRDLSWRAISVEVL